MQKPQNRRRSWNSSTIANSSVATKRTMQSPIKDIDWYLPATGNSSVVADITADVDIGYLPATVNRTPTLTPNTLLESEIIKSQIQMLKIWRVANLLRESAVKRGLENV